MAKPRSRGWVCKMLRDLATINYGKSPKEILSTDGLYPVLGTGGTERYGDGFLYDGDSIILGRKGTIDRVHFVTGRFWTIDTAYFLSDFNDTQPRWLFYSLQNLHLRQFNEATGVPSLSRDLLYKIEVETPPKPEQTKIAEILSTVDQAIDRTEALIAKQQCIKTGLMQDLLTRGIDKDGNLRSEDTHEFKDSPLGRIPVEWDVKLLEAITEKIADRDHTTPKYVQDGVLIVSPTSFCDDEGIDFSKCPRISPRAHLLNSQKTDCRRGDLILHRIGAGLGGVRVVLDSHPEYSILHSLALIRPDGMNSETSYLKWAFRSFDVQKQMRLGTQSIGVPDLGLEKIGSLRFMIPTTLWEQCRIGAVLDSNQSQIDSLLMNRKKLFKIKTALMQDLLTGEVSVIPLLTDTSVR